MFGLFGSKQSSLPVMERMSRYHMVLNFATGEYFLDKFSQSIAFKKLSEPDLRKIASSVTNLVFGRNDPLVKGVEISLGKSIELAMEHLMNNPLLMEVVIQSRRVMATLRYSKSGEVDSMHDFGWKLLERFGEHFPQEPNPGNYPELMDRFIQQLPSLVKARTLGIQKSIMEEGL